MWCQGTLGIVQKPMEASMMRREDHGIFPNSLLPPKELGRTFSNSTISERHDTRIYIRDVTVHRFRPERNIDLSSRLPCVLQSSQPFHTWLHQIPGDLP